MNVRFKNPPINELVIGAYFDPPVIALRSEHIGLLWSRFRSEFPKVEQREPILVGIHRHASPEIMANEFPFMPRFWFVSEDETNLIQVQKNAFLLNWRKRKAEYPHFSEHLKPCFDSYFAVFNEFLREDVGVSDLGIGACELTYIDVIDPCEYWQGPQDTSRLIPSFAVPDCATAPGVAPAFNCMYRYEIEPNCQLQIAIRTAEATGDPNSPRLILEFKTLGRPGSVAKSDLDAWYDQAHDAIVARFLSMTDEHVQRTHWIPEEAE